MRHRGSKVGDESQFSQQDQSSLSMAPADDLTEEHKLNSYHIAM